MAKGLHTVTVSEPWGTGEMSQFFGKGAKLARIWLLNLPQL